MKPITKSFRLLTTLFVFATCMNASAQTTKLIDHLEMQVRGDYQREYVGSEAMKTGSGFKGKYFNVLLSGKITPNLSWSFRQRLNRFSKASDFFDATDWIYLDYRPTKNWSFAAGKQEVYVGGYEYDRAPINIFFASEYWYNISPFQWGASVSYLPGTAGRDKFTLQVTQSPFRTYEPEEDMYSYSLLWAGNHGVWETLWSTNLLEYAPGKFIHYISLGNALNIGRFHIELDFMNRAVNRQTYLLRDCSAVGEVAFKASDMVNVFAKASYDVNKTNRAGDLSVLPGTELTRIGGGIEVFPLKKKDVRLHANYSYTWGTQTNPEGTLQNKQSIIDVGVTWNLPFIR